MSGRVAPSVRREGKRLRAIFVELCALSFAAPFLASACDESVTATPNAPNDAGADAFDATRGADVVDAGVDAFAGECATYAFDAASATYIDAAPERCADLVRLPCGLPPEMVAREECFLPINACNAICPSLFFNCRGWFDSCVDGAIPSGPITIDCVTCFGATGRRPRGLLPRREPCVVDAASEVLGAMARLESASVDAFRLLARDLAACGAPLELTREAARARRDEVRHARVLARLARRVGHRGRLPRALVRSRRAREVSLEELARENAVEGCVNETFSALLATWHAATATDPIVGASFARIAIDETRHAALAWATARWLESRLDGAARARVADARQRATELLERRGALNTEPSRTLGIPSVAVQRSLARALAIRLRESFATEAT